jgi:plastocyanin
VTANYRHHSLRIVVLSAFVVLAMFAFFVFGSGSAHAMTRQATSTSSTTTFVRIVTNSQGGAVFSPSAITVKSGAAVRITNRTAFARFVVAEGFLHRIGPGQGFTINPAQSEQVGICGGSGVLTITVV